MRTSPSPNVMTTSNPPLTREKFMKEVKYADEDLKRFASLIAETERKTASVTDAVMADDERRAAAEIDVLCRDTNKLANSIRARLKSLERANPSNGAEYVLRSNQNTRLARRFLEQLDRYQKAQSSYKTARQERLVRQFRIANPTADGDDLQKALSEYESAAKKDGSPGMFMQSVLSGKRGQAVSDMNDIQRRHDEILRMAVYISSLQQLFVEMEEIISKQETVVLQITDQVTKSVDDTVEGASEMKFAIRSEREARKKMCMIFGIVLILILFGSITAFVWLKEHNMLGFLFPPPLSSASIDSLVKNVPTANGPQNNTLTADQSSAELNVKQLVPDIASAESAPSANVGAADDGSVVKDGSEGSTQIALAGGDGSGQ